MHRLTLISINYQANAIKNLYKVQIENISSILVQVWEIISFLLSRKSNGPSSLNQ
jgi:hypothetical protein